MQAGNAEVTLDEVVALCKRRGFVFQSAEIYGGFRSTYDYGPIGVLLLRAVKDQWWRSMVQLRHDVVGLDASILSPPAIWEASGHLDNFTDPLVDCRDCGARHRQDRLDNPEVCPACGARGELTEARQFNLMFKTHVGPVEEGAAAVYLRPETAQGIFVNFQNVVNSSRLKPPFGIGQIGKAFRNEITTGNFIFRTREFEMMEIEYFVKPGEDEESHQKWISDCLAWYTDLGVDPNRLRVRNHTGEELSHYAKATADIEYQFPWGWGEIQGTANRTNFDLSAHSGSSGQSLSYFDEQSGEHKVPYVIEPAAGVDRGFLAVLNEAYKVEKLEDGKDRTVLSLKPHLSPIKAAVIPLKKNNEELVLAAKNLKDELQSLSLGRVLLENSGNIGKSYRRHDEVGTPLCITVDFQTLEDQTVTIRNRDSMDQERVHLEEASPYLQEYLR